MNRDIGGKVSIDRAPVSRYADQVMVMIGKDMEGPIPTRQAGPAASPTSLRCTTIWMPTTICPRSACRGVPILAQVRMAQRLTTGYALRYSARLKRAYTFGSVASQLVNGLKVLAS